MGYGAGRGADGGRGYNSAGQSGAHYRASSWAAYSSFTGHGGKSANATTARSLRIPDR
jgi:hypothetical protein